MNIDTSPVSEPESVRLQKVTLKYVEEQDRLAMLAEDSDGRSYAFWITRRLMSVLITHFTDLFSADSKKSQHQKMIDNLMLESEAQSAIQNHDKNTPPVNSDDLVEQVLVTTLDISHSDSLVALTWRTADKQFQLALTHSEFFQWFAAIKRTLHEAQWMLIWPSWLDATDELDFEGHGDKPAMH